MAREKQQHCLLHLEFDGHRCILSTTKEERTGEDYLNLFRLSSEYADKYLALNKIKDKSEAQEIILDAAQDPSEDIRLMAINALSQKRDAKLLTKIVRNDESSAVRTVALRRSKSLELSKEVIDSDESFRVISEALDIINKVDANEGLVQAKKLMDDYHKPLLGTMGEIFAKSKDVSHLDFFEKNINDVSMFGFFNYVSQYGKLAKIAEPQKVVSTAKYLKDVAKEESNAYFLSLIHI